MLIGECPLSLDSRRLKILNSNVRLILKADVQVKVMTGSYRPKADVDNIDGVG